MGLTKGAGPLAGSAAAPANYAIDGPVHRIHFEPWPFRLRAVVGGRTVLDTRRAHLLHETGILPVAYAPLEDFDGTLLERTATSTHCPFKGDASYWSVNGVEDALWAYERPIASAAWLAGLAALDRRKIDHFLAEEDRVFGPHLRDPYVRVDIVETARPVIVRAGETVVARSTRPKLLAETGLPVRIYVPPGDVVTGVLDRSTTELECPYKGRSTYWNVSAGDSVIEDGAWSYETPLEGALRIQGHFCFDLSEHLDVTLG